MSKNRNGNNGDGNGRSKWLKSKQSKRGGVKRNNRRPRPVKPNGKPILAT